MKRVTIYLIIILCACFKVTDIFSQNSVTYWKNGQSSIISAPDSIHFVDPKDYSINGFTIWSKNVPLFIESPDSILIWNVVPDSTIINDSEFFAEPTEAEQSIMEITSDEEDSEFVVLSEEDSLEFDNLAKEVLTLFSSEENDIKARLLPKRYANSDEDLAEEAIRNNGKNIFKNRGLIIEQQDWNSGLWGNTRYGGFETFYNTYEKYGRRYLLVVFYCKGGFPNKKTAYLKLGQVNSGKILGKSTISTGQEYTFMSVCIDDYINNFGCVNFFPLLINESSKARNYINPIFVKTDPLISPNWRTQYYGYEFGKINGVSVYFNDDSSKGNSNQGDGGFQCVELCKRYVKELNSNINRKLTDTWGNAKQWPANRLNDDKDPGEYLVFSNDGNQRIREGDLIVWNYGSYGHIGVVIKTTETYISVAHQNGGTGTNALPIGSTLKVENKIVKDIKPGSNKSPIFANSKPISHYIRINSDAESYKSFESSLTASTTNISFGRVQLGRSVTKSFDISNKGYSSLTISSMTTRKGKSFTLDASEATIDHGWTSSFNVTFTPNEQGEIKDQIIIKSNADDNPLWVINLSGEGYGDAPTNLTLSENSITLNISEKKTITITSGSGSYKATSSNSSVATASISNSTVSVTALKAGTAKITITDTKTNQSAAITVTVKEQAPISPDPVAVDLGLPSGAKWADRNVGASKPEGYGGYYAWGEIEEKQSFTWSNYKWGDGSANALTKYCNNSKYGIVDNKTALDPEDDVANVKWGGSWRIPTEEQFDELIENTDEQDATINGVKGKQFVSKINGNSIFIPLPGYYDEGGYHPTFDNNPGNLIGTYWLTSINTSGNFLASLFACAGKMKSFVSKIDSRFYGHSVRPVICESPAVYPDLAITANTLSLNIGESSTINITSGSGNYGISHIDDMNIAKGTLEGTTITIKAFAAGVSRIVVVDIESGQKIIITVTVEESEPEAIAVDLGLPSGTLWADRNIGASSPTEHGDYYAWGETEVKDIYYGWDTYKWSDSAGNFTKYSSAIDNKETLDLSDDVAYQKWGGQWRIPTLADIKELDSYCTSTWKQLNGVDGRLFKSNINGKTIFLPYSVYSDIHHANSGSCYWTSTCYQDNKYAYMLFFWSEGISFNIINERYEAGRVRPVYKSK